MLNQSNKRKDLSYTLISEVNSTADFLPELWIIQNSNKHLELLCLLNNPDKISVS
jgi:hypothetical protein